ncbi:MAG: SEC59/DGK1/VTE5 family protein [Candidatus Marinimicrobia bacterium]|jgi:dolichol kinase|nr:SEC59/DGK1/VTE5 family protein [Candidatus Neomarinimicrobiota bacterium]MEE2918142.1 SEC59/DGK1/VTE5 family protein [Candidatus Neomarinimicrobiota bacterium]
MIPLSEYKRKLIHLFNLAIPFSYLYIFPEKWVFVKLLSILMFLFIIFDILRHKVAWVKSLFTLFINSMLRSHEQEGKLTGATWVMIGAVISIILFSKPVAIIALIFMSLGDSAAGLIGQRYGKHKIWNKSWEGFFGGLFVCIIIGMNYSLLPMTISLSGAVAAMVMEILPIPLDDNFKIPLGAGAIMMMLSTPI